MSEQAVEVELSDREKRIIAQNIAKPGTRLFTQACDAVGSIVGERAEAARADVIESLAVEAESWPDDEDDAGAVLAEWLRARYRPGVQP